MTSLTQERQEGVDELRAIVRRFVADQDALGQARRMVEGGAYDAAPPLLAFLAERARRRSAISRPICFSAALSKRTRA